MRKDLIIYGASNPCVLKILNALNQKKPIWNTVGFIDDTPEKKGGEFYGHPILGGHKRIESIDLNKTYFFNNVFGSMSGRKKVAAILDGFNCRLASLISPDVNLAFVDTGKDVAIEQNVSLDYDIVIGDHCCVKRSASVGHETVLEKFVFIGPGATVCGRIKIREGAYIGAGSCIRQGLEIGKNSVVGAGAVVTRDVPQGVTVIGSPARPLRDRE